MIVMIIPQGGQVSVIRRNKKTDHWKIHFLHPAGLATKRNGSIFQYSDIFLNVYYTN